MPPYNPYIVIYLRVAFVFYGFAITIFIIWKVAGPLLIPSQTLTKIVRIVVSTSINSLNPVSYAIVSSVRHKI